MGGIRKADINDIDQIKSIIDKHISIDFYTIDELRNIVEDENSYICVYADDRNTVIGMSYVFVDKITSVPEIFNLNDGDYNNLVRLLPEYTGEKIGIFKTISVNPEYRGMGISEQLVASVIDWFKQKEIPLALGEAIIRPDGKVNAGRVNAQFGFKGLFRTKKPWSKIKSYCPYCNNDYCQCDAEIFIKDLGYEEGRD